MNLPSRITAAVAVTILYLGSAHASTGQSVDNFTLLDHRGDAQELYYDKAVKAIVLIVQGNGCQVVRSSLADYQALRNDYADRGVQVLMINSNLQDDRASIAKEAGEWGIDIPIMHDSSQMIGRSLGLSRTAEVLIVDPASKSIIYRGALNNRVDYERQKNEADETFARDALDQLLAGEKVAFREVESPGCIINFGAEAPAKQISYADDIVPILQKNCLQCHVEGGIAPWAMSEYRMLLGFAPMIREVLRTKRMPPWHADPEIGHWQDDAGISDQEFATLLSWIDAGAPRGEGPDPLQSQQAASADWPLGEPDLIIDIPAFEVPASGEVDYQYPTVANPLKDDSWVVAATIRPGDSTVVHHVLVGTKSVAPTDEDTDGVFENYIMGYAPGNESSYMPEGTGVLVPEGGYYLFQMHYTPTGKVTTDRSQIGLYFADTPPDNFLRQQVVLNPKISIPPGAARHEESAYFEFYEDATIYSLVPHSHYRGFSSAFDLIYPDGTEERVLSVPNYDFNWQRTYKFVEPVDVPAGTKIVHRTIYDNSTNNSGNPDPERRVPWGLQSGDEMLYGSVSFAWNAERSDAPIHDPVRFDTAQFVGFADTNMDGKVDKDEMPKKLRSGIGWKWLFLDKDFDGGLDLDEMTALMKKLSEDKGP